MLQTMAGREAGSASCASGYSQWRMAAWVAVILRALMPHAASVQYGAPDPPEKRDH